MLTTSSQKQSKRVFLSKQSTTIGRLDTNDIQINHGYVSREHAVIKFRHGHLYVFDTSSSGTWLNGVRLNNGGRGEPLRYDDGVFCPRVCLVYSCTGLDTRLSETEKI